ncbi:MAG TPA: maltose acetyltransferase, partial [Erysipelotrichaceae bacterium]|nr:maltose acetyltransferase [Erysipelotrichaceae bacterium]
MNSEKMRQGEWYDANHDPNILKDRLSAADLCFEVNQIKPSDPRRDEVFKKLFGQEFENLVIMT